MLFSFVQSLYDALSTITGVQKVEVTVDAASASICTTVHSIVGLDEIEYEIGAAFFNHVPLDFATTGSHGVQYGMLSSAWTYYLNYHRVIRFETTIPCSGETSLEGLKSVYNPIHDQYPHTCDCGSPAYRGLSIECTNKNCLHFGGE